MVVVIISGGGYKNSVSIVITYSCLQILLHIISVVCILTLDRQRSS